MGDQRPRRIIDFGGLVLREDMIAAARAALSAAPPGDTTTFRTIQGEEIARHDLESLNPRTYVNSTVINTCLRLFVAHVNSMPSYRFSSPISANGTVLPRAAFITTQTTTYIQGRLRDELALPTSIARLSTWTIPALSPEAFLQIDTVLLPFNLGNNHWTLVILSPSRRQLDFMDSLSHPGSPLGDRGRVELGATRAYLQAFLGPAYRSLDWLEVHVAPQHQGATVDCGIYLLSWAELAAAEASVHDLSRSFIVAQRKRLFVLLVNGGFSQQLPSAIDIGRGFGG